MGTEPEGGEYWGAAEGSVIEGGGGNRGPDFKLKVVLGRGEAHQQRWLGSGKVEGETRGCGRHRGSSWSAPAQVR